MAPDKCERYKLRRRIFHISYKLLHVNEAVNEKINSSFQKNDGDDDDEKKIVYNTVGPNVCMGDHKV